MCVCWVWTWKAWREEWRSGYSSWVASHHAHRLSIVDAIFNGEKKVISTVTWLGEWFLIAGKQLAWKGDQSHNVLECHARHGRPKNGEKNFIRLPTPTRVLQELRKPLVKTNLVKWGWTMYPLNVSLGAHLSILAPSPWDVLRSLPEFC